MSVRAILAGLLLGLGAGRAGAQGGIAARIREAPVSETQRQALLEMYSRHDYPALERELAAKPETPPQQAGALLSLLGALEFVANRTGPAVKAFESAEALRPLDDRDRFTFAMALANLGRSKEASVQLTQLSELHPDQALFVYWLGRIEYYERRYELAIEKFRKAIQLDPKFGRAWDNLGLALDMNGDQAGAQDAFEKAVDLNRKLPSPSAWPPHNYGALQFRMQKFPEAEKSLREALRYDPRFAQAHYYLGRVLEKLERNEDAIAELKSAAELDANLAEPLYTLGLLYRRLGRIEDSRKALEEYRRRHPEGQ